MHISSTPVEVELAEWFAFLTEKYHLDNLYWQYGLTREPINPSLLPQEEKQYLTSISSSRRRSEWLIGREALRLLLPSREQTISVPHRAISLSHSGGLAISFLVRSVFGVGIDLQLKKEVRPELLTRIIHPDDRTKALSILEVWNIKEALYKANPRNHGSKLSDYQIVSCDRQGGQALWFDTELEFKPIDFENWLICFALKLIRSDEEDLA